MSKTKWTVDLVKGLLYRRDGDGFTCAVGAVCSKAGELVQILRRGQAKHKICVWTWDADRSTSTSACGYKSRWFDDDPRNKVHGTNYCHACGGKVVWKEKELTYERKENLGADRV